MFYTIPLQDPAVQQAAGNNAARAQQGLEEYNPFDASQTSKSSVCFFFSIVIFQVLIGNTPCFMQDRGVNPPPTIQAAPVTPQQPTMTTAEFQVSIAIFIMIIKK